MPEFRCAGHRVAFGNSSHCSMIPPPRLDSTTQCLLQHKHPSIPMAVNRFHQCICCNIPPSHLFGNKRLLRILNCDFKPKLFHFWTVANAANMDQRRQFPPSRLGANIWRELQRGLLTLSAGRIAIQSRWRWTRIASRLSLRLPCWRCTSRLHRNATGTSR